MKEEKKEVKIEKKDDEKNVLYSISRRVDKIVKWMESVHGVDIDGDGKVGAFTIKGMLVTFCSAILTVGAVLATTEIDNKSQGTGTYTLIQSGANTGAITLTVDTVAAEQTLDDGSTITGGNSNGTVRSAVRITPTAFSASPTWITRYIGVNVGEPSGTTAYGFGDTNTAGYGFLSSWGRTVAATANWDGVNESALEARMINRMTNDAAYKMTGGHIKAKNYSTGTVGDIRGLWVEAVDDGTTTTSSGLYISTDSSEINYLIDMDEASTPLYGDIRFSNGGIIKNGDANTLTITEATVACSAAVTVGTDLTVSGGDITGLTTTAIDMGEATSGTIAVTASNTTISGTATVTGVLTMTARPTLTTTNAPGVSVVFPANCPASDTNAVWATVTIAGQGTNVFVVPCFKL